MREMIPPDFRTDGRRNEGNIGIKNGNIMVVVGRLVLSGSISIKMTRPETSPIVGIFC